MVLLILARFWFHATSSDSLPWLAWLGIYIHYHVKLVYFVCLLSFWNWMEPVISAECESRSLTYWRYFSCVSWLTHLSWLKYWGIETDKCKKLTASLVCMSWNYPFQLVVVLHSHNSYSHTSLWGSKGQNDASLRCKVNSVVSYHH